MDFFEKYTAIGVGLFFGSLAHFGRSFHDGEKPRVSQVVGYIMQLGVIGLMSANAVELLNIGSELSQSTLACILAVSALDVVKWVRSVGWRRVIDTVLPAQKDGE